MDNTISFFHLPARLFVLFLAVAGLLVAPAASRAQETLPGPVLLDNDAPYLSIDGVLTFFNMTIADREPEQLAGDWSIPAPRALALVANNVRPRSFAQAPAQPSHQAGDDWYSVDLPASATLVLSWDAAGYDGPAMWFAARWDGMRLAVYSSRVDPSAPDRWYPLEPGKSSYDQWTADDLRVEMEIFLPDNFGRTVLYRFRPVNQAGEVMKAQPAPPSGAEETPSPDAPAPEEPAPETPSPDQNGTA
ncbi:hypothetical protein [Oceanidesulfovibrio marinus]|uniref:Uncharacterized protein n=1 Tax=Oceanidesulfovibrio marinus TaxID=370038 RepID=A0ABX6NNC2_9BACT|nr:hypothetical protein [Oceanidesulfovibrio marinus]QJT11120.1 hypothetical protein E8L03_20360 [Oceanidesulfovibrio marinus]